MALVVKSLPANSGDIRDPGSIAGFGRSLGGEHGNPLVFVPGESHGQRSLAGTESDTTEMTAAAA